MLKLPSIQSLWLGASQTVKRFPLQFLLSILSVIILWLIIDVDYKHVVRQNQLYRILYGCNFALTLLLATDLFCEAKTYTETRKWGLRALVILLCTGLYFSLNPWFYNADLYRIFLLGFAFHLLVAFAPYLGHSNLNGFWQYNKSLFLRFLIAFFYSGVLYAGLAIALVAIDGLFNVKIDYKIYLKLLAFVGVGFNTLFFLSGVPTNFENLDNDTSYPKGLKIFTQYVLIPLMTIYLAILLVYEIKIAIEWQLPKGMVSTLILGYAVFGILSLLLIYPIKEAEGNGWIRLFSKFFYLMMLPLIVLLILAIIKRVGHYGITEPRYILMVLAIWLSFISTYFLFNKQQNIKIIPISLAILALLASYGPQSAFSISKASQTSRLAKLMKSNVPKHKGESAAVVRYLVRNHGLTSLQQFTKTDLQTIETKLDQKNTSKYNWETKQNKVDTAFAILKVKDVDLSYHDNWLYFSGDEDNILDVSGYDAILPLTNGHYKETVFNGDSIIIGQKKNNANANERILITINKEKIVFNMNSLAKSIYSQYKNGSLKKDGNQRYLVDFQRTPLTASSSRYNLKFLATEINVDDKDEQHPKSLYVNGYLLLKKK